MDPWVERELKQYTFLDLNAMVDGGATFSHRGDVAVVSWASGPSGPSGRQSHPFFRTYSHMEFKPGRLERYHVGVGEAWGKLCEVLALRLGVPEGPWEKRVYWSDPGGQVRFAVVWLRKEGLVGSVLPVASPSVVVPWLPLGYQERVLIVRPTVYEITYELPRQDAEIQRETLQQIWGSAHAVSFQDDGVEGPNVRRTITFTAGVLKAVGFLVHVRDNLRLQELELRLAGSAFGHLHFMAWLERQPEVEAVVQVTPSSDTGSVWRVRHWLPMPESPFARFLTHMAGRSTSVRPLGIAEVERMGLRERYYLPRDPARDAEFEQQLAWLEATFPGRVQAAWYPESAGRLYQIVETTALVSAPEPGPQDPVHLFLSRHAEHPGALPFPEVSWQLPYDTEENRSAATLQRAMLDGDARVVQVRDYESNPHIQSGMAGYLRRVVLLVNQEAARYPCWSGMGYRYEGPEPAATDVVAEPSPTRELAQGMVARTLATPEGRRRLAEAMTAPIRGRLTSMGIARALLPVQPLPDGAVPAYLTTMDEDTGQLAVEKGTHVVWQEGDWGRFEQGPRQGVVFQVMKVQGSQCQVRVASNGGLLIADLRDAAHYVDPATWSSVYEMLD